MDSVLTDDLDQLETKLGRLETLCSVNRVSDNAITDFFQALYEHDFGLNVDPGHVSADSGKDVYLALFRKHLPDLAYWHALKLPNAINSCVDTLLSRMTWDQFHAALDEVFDALDADVSSSRQSRAVANSMLHKFQHDVNKGRLQRLHSRSSWAALQRLSVQPASVV